MVMNAQPIYDCCQAILAQFEEQGRPRPHIVFMTAAGQPYTEQVAKELAAEDGLILVCGHYEGMDERVIEELADREISIGDYVLTGGELAALVVADSVLRLQPGVLAEPQGYQEESHWNGCWNIPSTPAPKNGGAARCPRCCSAPPRQHRRMACEDEPGAHETAPSGFVRKAADALKKFKMGIDTI